MKFFLSSYELHAPEGEQGEIMVAKLSKTPDEQRSTIVGITNEPKKVGIAGKMELYIFDQFTIEKMKNKVGQEIDVEVRI